MEKMIKTCELISEALVTEESGNVSWGEEKKKEELRGVCKTCIYSL